MSNPILASFSAALLAIVNAGCSSTSSGAPRPNAPVAVRVVQASQRNVPIYQEWLGTLDGVVNSEIKAEVSGYLVEQAYKEGSAVVKGQLLFQIDPRPLQ